MQKMQTEISQISTHVHLNQVCAAVTLLMKCGVASEFVDFDTKSHDRQGVNDIFNHVLVGKMPSVL